MLVVRSRAAKEETDAAGGPAWWRARMRGDHTQNRRRREGGLTMERIVETTLRIAGREGLEVVSMRRVAEELGTGAASLYRHFASRDELLAVVADAFLGTLRLSMESDDSWRERCLAFARSFRAALLDFPAGIELVAKAQLLGPNALKGRERILSLLLAEGFSPELAARSFLTVTHYVIGAVLLDSRTSGRATFDPGERQALFAELDPSEYPSVVALAGELGGMHPDDEFEFGLGAILDGIEARLALAAESPPLARRPKA